MTFDKFARAILDFAPEPIRPISRLMKRQLIRRLIDDFHGQGRLKHFRPIARTSGLVDLVCDFISELKRLEVWPEHFHRACAARGISDKDVELLELYDAYQQCLREAHLYDAEGLFWSARDWLSRSRSAAESGGAMRRFWGRLRLVVADGFTDFTRTQHEILEILAAGAEQVLITLPLEGEPRRADLLSKPLRTLDELRRRHTRVSVEEVPRPQRPPWPALAHLEQRLFGNPRHAQPAADATGVEIIAAARQMGEIELIGARIKGLLIRGEARPGEIAVVFRSLQDVAALLGEVFGDLGIPFALEVGQPLDRAPALRALVALLQLDAKDWPAGNLLAVVGSNYFQPDWPEWSSVNTVVAVEKAVRRLQTPGGRQRLIEQLERAAGGDIPEVSPLPEGEGQGVRALGTADSTQSHRPHPNPLPLGEGTDARLSLALLRRLAHTLGELPQRATLADWAAAWQRLAQQTGLLRAVAQEEQCATACLQAVPGMTNPYLAPGEYTRGAPSLAWDRLQAALGEADRLEQWLDRQPPQLDRHEALAALLDILASEQVGYGGDDSGCVRVLSAASVRGLRIAHLFLAGLAEKAFPPPDREDRLYSEAEYQRLIDEGLPLVAHTQRNREEMLLFYEAVTRATRRLYLSYPALDESAQPLSPSPYLKEVEQACGPGRIRRTELTDLSPIPADGAPLLCDEAFRVKAVSAATEGNVALLAGLIRQEAHPCATACSQAVLAGLEITHLRQDRKQFGPAEGMILGEAAQAYLATYYAPHRTFSATELEQYASCPYRFSLERLLKLEPIEDLALQVDFLTRGLLAHDLLAALHRAVNQLLGRPGSPLQLEPADYEGLLGEALRAVLPPETSNPVAAAMQEVDRRLLVRWFADYRRQHECYDALWQECDAPLVPELFEVSFGRSGGDPPSTAEPLELVTDRQTVRISGRIDRVDTGRMAGHVVFNVLDYKTGGAPRFSAEAVAAGTALQLPLYVFAVSDLLLNDRNAVPWQAGYWQIRDGGFKPRQALKMYRRDSGDLVVEPAWEQVRGQLAGTVVALVRGLRRGEFPVCSQDDECTGRCPFRTVCRINQIRSLEKTWQPPSENH